MSVESTVASSPETLKAGDRVVFLGDSLTQSGVRPGGYVSLIEHAIREQFDLGEISVIGSGISGNKIPDCLERLQRDVIAHQPSHVVVFAGINDIWKTTQGQGTTVEDFESAYREIIAQLTGAGCKIYVCTPALIGERVEPPNSMDQMIDQYGEIVRKLAETTESTLIDLRRGCQEYLKKNNQVNRPHSVLTTDGVHLNSTGNRFVARLICQALDIETRIRPSKALKHLIMFRFGCSVEDPMVRSYLERMEQCVMQHELALDCEVGTNVSSEQKSNGFTHIVSMTFVDEADRGVFLGDAGFVNLMGESGHVVEDTMIFDYWVEKTNDIKK